MSGPVYSADDLRNEFAPLVMLIALPVALPIPYDLMPVTVGELQRMKGLSERGHGKTVSVLQKSASTKQRKPSVGALLIGAFELGWHIGEKIDEDTGISDRISDFLAEHFPWPW